MRTHLQPAATLTAIAASISPDAFDVGYRADGRPIKVALTGGAPTGLADGTWVQAVGRYSTEVGQDPLNTADIAYLAVTSWQEIPAPAQPYE